MKIPVPFIEKLAVWPTGEVPAHRVATMRRIKDKYGPVITAASLLSNVPEELLYAVIFKETRGENLRNPKSSATGLMQIFPTTAEGFLVMENRSGNLTPAERQVLRRFLGSRLDELVLLKKGQTKNLISRADLDNTEFNIFVGAICWSVLLRLFAEPNGIVRLDRAWSQYAWGTGTKPPNVTITEFFQHIQRKGWGDYFKMLAGREGALHLATTLGVATRPSLSVTA